MERRQTSIRISSETLEALHRFMGTRYSELKRLYGRVTIDAAIRYLIQVAECAENNSCRGGSTT